VSRRRGGPPGDAGTGPRPSGSASGPPPGTEAAPAPPAREGPKLPAWGLAADILAGLGEEAPPDAEQVAPLPPAAAAAPDRLYSFADALERRGQEARVPEERPVSWVLFELAGERYGLPVTAVQEILRVGTITRVPHAPAPVRGITNLRGRVLAVVDLRVRLGLPPADPDVHSRILVVESRRRTLSLLVDAAHQVVKLIPSALEPPPADVMTERSHYLLGVYHLEDQLIIALDVDRVLLIQDEDLAVVPPPEAAAAAGDSQHG
jgi:purine-binding chemotaxis protein CheW